MRKPKCELKNVKTFIGDEGLGFNADLYIDGVKCIFVIDDANGGELNFQRNFDKSPKFANVGQLIDELEAYIKTMPKEPMMIGSVQHKNSKGELVFYDNNLESYVNSLFDKVMQEKENKKIAKKFETGIAFGIPNATSFQILKFNTPLKNIAKGTLQAKVFEIQLQYCKNGVVILNDNLEKLGIVLK